MYKKKFCASLILSLSIIIAIYICYMAFAHLFMMKYMNFEYPTFEATKTLSQTETYHDLVVLGDSRAKAGFIPNKVKSFSSINLALGGGTPIEGYYTLKRYLDKNKPPKALLLSYTPSTHYGGSDTFWERAMKFRYIHISDYIEIERYASNLKKMQKKLHMEYERITYVNFIKLFVYFKVYHSEISTFFRKDRDDNVKILSEVIASKGHVFYGTNEKGSSELAGEHRAEKFIFDDLNFIYLNKIISLANKKSIQIFFYSMPNNKATFLKLNPKYKSDYTNFIKKYCLENSCINLNTFWSLDDKYFGDSSHVYGGANITTDDIEEKLQQYLSKTL